MPTDLERMLRDARPAQEPPDGTEARLRTALGLEADVRAARPGVPVSRWRRAARSRTGRLAGVAILLGVGGTALAAGVVHLRGGAGTSAVTAQASTTWHRMQVLSAPVRGALPGTMPAVSADGRAAVVWDTGDGGVRLRMRLPDGRWLPATALGAAGESSDPAVAVAADGRGWVLWRRRRTGRVVRQVVRDPLGRPFDVLTRRVGVRYAVMAAPVDLTARRVGAAVRVSDETPRMGDLVDIRAGVDADGRVTAAWVRLGRVEVATGARTGRGWAAPQRLATPAAGTPRSVSVAVSRTGTRALAWIVSEMSGTFASRTIVATAPSNGPFEQPQIVADGADAGNRPALAVDSRGATTVAWRGGTVVAGRGGRLWASRRVPGGSWSAPQGVSSTGLQTGAAALAVDGEDRVVALWSQATPGHEDVLAGVHTRTWAATSAGGGWSPPAQVSTAGVDRDSRVQNALTADTSGRVVALVPQGMGVDGLVWTPGRAPERTVVTPTAGFAAMGMSIAAGRDGTVVATGLVSGRRGTRIVALTRQPEGR